MLNDTDMRYAYRKRLNEMKCMQYEQDMNDLDAF